MTATPFDWVELMITHDGELVRVRLVWRTGSCPYRPMIPIYADLEELEDAPDSAWDALESHDTHFHWTMKEGETAAEKKSRVSGVATRLWGYCRRYARATGQCCDFQLRGYKGEDELLFECGHRFDPNREQRGASVEDARPPEPSPNPEDSSPTRDPADFEAESRRMHELKDALIERLTEERNRTDDRFREIAQESPTLITHASDIIERAIAYQERAVEGLVNQRTGEIECRIRAFSEKQETHREALRLEWRRYALDTVLGNVIPVSKSIFEAWANRPTNPFPQFEHAQQAIAYLGMTLDESQLSAVFRGSREAAKTFLKVLEHASGLKTEREAVQALQGSEAVFRGQRFRSAVTPEQQLAARFILGRAAMFRMGNFDPRPEA